MDSKARAEKIVPLDESKPLPVRGREELRNMIAAEIDAAVKEAREQGKLDAIPDADKNWAEMHKHELAESFSQGAEWLRGEAAKAMSERCEKKRACPEGNTGHDDRWCAMCENIKDTYDMAERAIRSFPTSPTGETPLTREAGEK